MSREVIWSTRILRLRRNLIQMYTAVAAQWSWVSRQWCHCIASSYSLQCAASILAPAYRLRHMYLLRYLG